VVVSLRFSRPDLASTENNAIEGARRRVREGEERVWHQTVRTEEFRAGGHDTEAAERLLVAYRDDLQLARDRLRHEEIRANLRHEQIQASQEAPRS
jgi:hypothetical protein